MIGSGWLNSKMRSAHRVLISSRDRLDGRRPLPTYVLSGRWQPMVLFLSRKDHIASCKLPSRSPRSRMMIKDRSDLSRKILIIQLEMMLPPLLFWLPGDGIEPAGRRLHRLPLLNRRLSDEEAS